VERLLGEVGDVITEVTFAPELPGAVWLTEMLAARGILPSIGHTGMPEGTVPTYKDGRQVYVEKGVLRMIDEDPKIHGNLTGSAVTMNVALRRLTQFTGLPVQEAVRWISLNPAMALGLDRETGSLKPGKWADICLFDEAFEVKRTFLKGRQVYRAE
jgi:N-acetylglucosamine-6-phosphate deacetylase